MPTSPYIFATTNREFTADFIRGLSIHLAEAVGLDQFHESEVLALIPESERHLLPESLPGARTILEVRMATPYYGEGYERGYWPGIAAVLEFLRRRVPGEVRVWYGPGGQDNLWEVTGEWLDDQWEYWAKFGGRLYFERR